MKYYLLIIMLLLSSCYTPKKAEKQVIKAQISYPAVVANHCATIYPPKIDTFIRTEIKQGATVTEYDTIKIDCDSVNHFAGVSKMVKVPIGKIKYRVDTFTREVVRNVENTAKTSYLEANIKQIQKANDSINSKFQSEKNKVIKIKGARNIWRWIAIGLGAFLLLPIFIKNIFPILKARL